MSIEHSRKHGPFDTRYPPIRRKPAPAIVRHLGDERLDWRGFLAGFYPDSLRHDFDALAAYQSYCGGGRRAGRGHLAARPAANETERWESEGGATSSLRESWRIGA